CFDLVKARSGGCQWAGPKELFPYKDDIAAAIYEDIACIAVDPDLLAAKGYEALAAIRSADFQIERGRRWNVRVVRQQQARSLLVQDNGLELVGKKGLYFAEILFGLGELPLARHRRWSIPVTKDESDRDADDCETD